MSSSRRFLRFVPVAVVALAALPALASQDIFLETSPRIKGGVQSKGLEGQMEISSFSIGYSVPRDPATGMASGKVVLTPVVITKGMDIATPLLMQGGSSGQSFAELKLALSHPSPAGDGYRSTLRLQNAVVSEWRLVDSAPAPGATAAPRPVEQITFLVQSYSVDYATHDSKINATGPVVSGSVGGK